MKLKGFCTAKETIKKMKRDFPGGTVAKNPPANAGDTGSSLGQGRFPHTADQLRPCATTTEPAL